MTEQTKKRFRIISLVAAARHRHRRGDLGQRPDHRRRDRERRGRTVLDRSRRRRPRTTPRTTPNGRRGRRDPGARRGGRGHHRRHLVLYLRHRQPRRRRPGQGPRPKPRAGSNGSRSKRAIWSPRARCSRSWSRTRRRIAKSKVELKASNTKRGPRARPGQLRSGSDLLRSLRQAQDGL